MEDASSYGIDIKEFDSGFTGNDVTLHFNMTGIISESINERAVLNQEQLKNLKE